MRISICGSISFYDEMSKLSKQLEELGFMEVLWPNGIGADEKFYKENSGLQETAERKIEQDFINKHYHKILKSDCIIVANYEKKGIEGYIGGNSFLEMGFAFVLGKPIFLVNPIPDVSYQSEILGMKPIVLNGDLTKITEYYQLSK